jgi:pimeloyl-ACP methyl ester carboxylesterase
MKADSREIVVLVHGVWMRGAELQVLARRLSRAGYTPHMFHYPSLRCSPAENGRTLALYLKQFGATRVHLVAHSLGGLVVCHALAHGVPSGLGRVVMLASPLQGSQSAQRLQTLGLGWILGRSRYEGLLGGLPSWPSAQALAMIAGTRGFGLGRLLPGKLTRPHDGTIALIETQAPEVSDFLAVPHGHFGMLFARDVARAVARYLDCGRF